jgi:hypothetical protein
MTTVSITSLDELDSALRVIPAGSLFRGQVRHYVGPDGRVSWPTSHVRKGCIPPELRKWSFYAQEALVVAGVSEPAHDLVQALLQHYGWRSFYIDLTANPAVACWFASNSYTERLEPEAAEDCDGEPLLLTHRRARYEPHEGEAHLYAIASDRVVAPGVRCIDLSASIPTNSQPRFIKQAGWLAGPLRDTFDPDCVIAHVSGPAEVFRQFANNAGLRTTADLFPDDSKDWFLKIFQSVPWRLTGSTSPPAFSRDLDLPDYHSPPKRYGPETAFPWFRELPRIPEQPVTFHVPDEMFYASPSLPPEGLPRVAALVRAGTAVHVETERLIRLPEELGSDYGKGFYLRPLGSDAVEVGSLIAQQRGLTFTGVGAEVGWHYRIKGDGSWERSDSPGQCPCKKPFRHERLLKAVVAFDWLLGQLDQESPTRIKVEIDRSGLR